MYAGSNRRRDTYAGNNASEIHIYHKRKIYLSRLCQRMLAIQISRSLAETTAIVDQISTDVAHDDNTQGFPRPSAICRRSSGCDLHVKRPGSPESRNAS